MEQHPIPRQITTFEFKLIGFMTIKQFLYLVVFIPLAFIIYTIFPIPLLNILLGLLVAGAGVAFAFVPVNDRPLDVWIRNLVRRLTSPTQYFYRKHNRVMYFLNNLVFTSDPHRAMAHIESREKLAAYLASTKQSAPKNPKKQIINNLLQHKQVNPSLALGVNPQVELDSKQTSQQSDSPTSRSPKTPFFTGTVKNHKLIPLPGILIYVKDGGGQTLRLLKTNANGVFATFNSLPAGEYGFEFKDPRDTYFFDTMKMQLEAVNSKPLEFFSKEML